jgi:fibronectin-binding autotransporter adhesin
MRTRKNTVVVMAAMATLAAAGISRAASGTWTETAADSPTTNTGLWSFAGNWASSIIADGAGNTATFNVPTTAVETIHLDTARTIGNLTFNNSSTTIPWILDNNGSASDVLTLNTSSGTPTITTSTAGSTVTISAALAGTQGLNFIGPGNLVLSSPSSTFSGAVSMTTPSGKGGALQIASTGALGNATSINVLCGATYGAVTQFQVAGGAITPNIPLTMDINTTGRAELDSTGTGIATINGNVTITDGDSGHIAQIMLNTANLVINGNLSVTNYANLNFQLRSNTGSYCQINGNVTLPTGVNLITNQNAPSTFTYVLNGTANSFSAYDPFNNTLQMGQNNVMPAGARITDTTGNSSGQLDLNGTSQTVLALDCSTNTDSMTIGSSSKTANSLLTITNTSGTAYNYRGTIKDVITALGTAGSSTGTQKVGIALTAGTQTLSGADTYTNGTSITGGTLITNNASALGTGSVTVTAPGTLNNNSGTYALLTNLSLNGATITANTGLNATSNGSFGLAGTVTVSGSAASTIASGSGASNNYVQIGTAASGGTTTFNVASTGSGGADLAVNVPIANFQNGTGYSAVSNLTKTGSGTLQLNAASTYVGATTITGGTLQLGSGGSIANSTVISVGSGAIFDTTPVGGYTTVASQTLDGLGTIKGAVTQNAGLITPGTVGTPGGVLTFNDGLTLNGGALQFDLTGNPADSTNDQITVTAPNGLTDNAPTTPLSVQFAGMPSGSEVYRLFNYSGTLNGSWLNSNFAITTNLGRNVLTVDTSTPGQVNLDVSASMSQNLIWASTSSQNWDIQTSKNWNNTSTPALSPDYFYNGDAVTFDDTPGVQTSISLVGSLQPATVIVNSVNNAFTFSGTGSIVGNTGLTKAGSSVLTISNSNTYSGTTTINGGTLLLNNTTGGALGTGSVTVGPSTTLQIDNSTAAALTNTGITDNGTVTYNGSTSGTIALPITGTGSLVMTGTGALALTASNSYTGGTSVNSGVVYGVANSNAFGGALGGAVVINPSGQIYFNDSGGNFPNAFTLNQNGSATSVVQAGGAGTTTISGPVSLTSDSAIHIDGNATLLLSNTSALTSNNYSLTVAGDGGSTLALAGNVSLGTGQLLISTTLSLSPAAATTITVSSTIANNGTGTGVVVQSGTGTSVLSGSNSYTGGVTVNAGILEITNNNALGATSAVTNINNAATLQLANNITSAENFSLSGRTVATADIENLNGSNTLTGNISCNVGGNQYNLQSDAGSTLTYTGTWSQAGGTLLRYYNLQGAGNGIISGSVTNGTATPALTMNGTGTWTLSGTNGYTGGTIVNSGNLIFSGGASFPAVTSLAVNGGVAQIAAHTGGPSNVVALTASSLTLAGTTGAWTGLVDLTNNDLIVRGGSLSTITDQIRSAFAGGTWTGAAGITSSTAASDSTHLTAVGVELNDNGGSAIVGSLDGASTIDGDVLIKYTYYGDANLDGAVDGSDYTLIDAGFNSQTSASPASGWQNGDFNYDGKIDGSDYTLIDNAFNTQSSSLGTNPAALVASSTSQIAGQIAGATSAVPEPATLGLITIGAIGLLGRRRRR